MTIAGTAGAGERATRLPMVPFLFILGDLLIIQILVLLSIGLRLLITPLLPIIVHPSTFAGVQVGAAILPLAYMAAGLYPGYGMTGVQRLQARTSFTVLCFGAMILFDYLAQGGQWSRGILLIAGVLVIVVMPIWDAVFIHVLLRRKLWGCPVVVFGPEAQRRIVVSALGRQPELGWIPVAEAEGPDGRFAVGGIANTAIITLGAQATASPDLETLPFRTVVMVPSLEDAQTLWVSVRDLGGLIGLEMRRNLLNRSSQALKRVIDLIAVALLALPVGLVVGLFILAVRLISPGPAFYFQERGGRGGRTFPMMKLRTMVLDAETRLQTLLATDPQAREEWAASMKLRHDPRIIPWVGHFMRRFSIDELPQLWHVLRGDMSLVGPRPLPGYHLDVMSPTVTKLRSQVRPGVTGLWQVSGRSELSLADQQRFDVYYVRNWSLWLDIHILGRTVLAVLRGTGAR
ncbi:exopolysaccharide biosynthesis polyprenyl glycosylphosphotransferase [Azospirillum sp. B4]|uniref:exopolysaccharide biosynthesis polyprenyl glycosylphosphotransferase n=1 Tax=Azospirillum sp. B4 TaxID=95605 RepID=UPI00034A06C6|nr:exopolysaccharide biosynthesis polyprenyl glycosylphosphotransferase [Azospirillum sp. B4]